MFDWIPEPTPFHFSVLMLIVALIAVIVVLVLLDAPPKPCSSNPYSQVCLDWRMDNCLATDRYTREECIQLVGAK